MHRFEINKKDDCVPCPMSKTPPTPVRMPVQANIFPIDPPYVIKVDQYTSRVGVT